MEQKLDKLLQRMNEVEKSLKTDILKTNNDITEIKNICLINQEKYVELENVVKQQKKTINFLHKEVNKNNLVVFGLVEADENIMEELITIINEKLNIPLQHEDICKMYRLGRKDKDNSGPVKVVFYDYKLKTRIYNERVQLRGTQVFLNEDLPKDIRVQNSEKRNARQQSNKKRLAQQSSEENDTLEERITQGYKRIRNTNHQPEKHDRPTISKSNSPKK